METGEAVDSMRAVILEQEGAPELLRVGDVPIPEPGPGEALVRVTAASLNHLDVWIRIGLPSVPKPRVMGADACGVVARVGDDGDVAWLGQRVVLDPSITCGHCIACVAGETVFCTTFSVLGEHRDGTHAQYVCVPVANLHGAPEHLDDHAAAALPLVHATAWRMLFGRGRGDARAGETVLIWGASGGVGAAALQLAAHAGLRTIATSRSERKREACRTMGADAVVDSGAPDVAQQVLGLTRGRGVDLVIDHLGEVSYGPSLRALRPGGRLVTCGATTGANPPAAITRLFWRQISVIGSTMATKAEFTAMLRFVEQQRIVPTVDRVFPLTAIAAAHRYLEDAEHVGKIVLDVVEGS